MSIPLKIGDTVEIDGREFEVWSVTYRVWAGQTTGSLELADLLIAAQWREENKAKAAHTALMIGGKMEKLADETLRQIDDSNEQKG